ncbi:baseplate wedge subunit [Morganella phage vB_MmoM_MP1]|uniref:Baseplate wedge subunit and tail pin n=1 Tax=Morganella phage vB_MmoM_MP1 TaxID=1852628 RepID=A0A192YBA8_9CAUD|nr:baseplate wedge subunit [Morganella phage vB_MmoM_MP1]ANM46405.1 baseplate wedge subunit and tail pin [Morganella phage vB_MmoM_MP1]
MKKIVNIGSVVDDGRGDYLRKGGEKINDNFNELYGNLGDGETPHAAGAWKIWDANDGELNIKFGQSFTVNTYSAPGTVNLPKGSADDYNKVVKVRDVWGSFSRYPLTVVPAIGDTMKGSPTPAIFNKDLQDLELVYCPPGRWEYAENKFVNKIQTSDLSTVIREQIIATEGQIDFLNVFGSNAYNKNNTEVYLRGNILYYSTDGIFNKDTAEYGSPDGSELGPLNGTDIRLRTPCEEGDVITVVSYLDGVSSWKSSYSKKLVRVLDKTITNEESREGFTYVMDLKEHKIPLKAFGILESDSVNPFSAEVLINGVQLISDLDSGQTLAFCEGFDTDSEEICIANGYTWNYGESDYYFERDLSDKIVAIVFPKNLEHNDIVTLRWFNNNIGTTLEIDQIKDELDDRYISSGDVISLTGRIAYTDTSKPEQSTVIPIEDDPYFKISNFYNLFDVIYPLGTIYENAHNPNNPAKYMGVGTWVRYAEGRVLAGWDSDEGNAIFNLNQNDLDPQGNPSKTAGGDIGAMYKRLIASNIPRLESNEIVLVKDQNGSIIIGGCQFDPDSEGPAFDKYREEKITINTDTQEGLEIEIIQPTRTVYRWVRVA